MSPNDPNVPLLIFIIICFFGVILSIIFYENSIRAPSLFAMSVQFSFVLVSCIVLIIVGMISVRMEWVCMILCVMLFSFNFLGIISPDILLYNDLS